MRDIEVEADSTWNVYWDKEKILKKIEDIMRWHIKTPDINIKA